MLEGRKDDSANGVPRGQRSRGDLSRVACLCLTVQLACATSPLFLSPEPAAVVRQKLVQEVQVTEYAGSVAHFYKLKKKKKKSFVFSILFMSCEAARVNENNRAGNWVDTGLE